MISVVIPTYNRADSLKNCLNSLKKQIFKDFEVIIVDDGSKDNTKEVFDLLKNENFRYVYKENGGQSSARNLGVREAMGDIIAFTDDDCVVCPEWLKEVNDRFVGDVKCVKGRTEVMNISPFTKKIKKHIYSSSSAATNNIAYNRSAIMSVGLFDESMRLHEDLDLLWRFKLAGFKKSYNDDMVVFHEFEKNMGEFKKVCFNRGIGLRTFFGKYLKIKPVIAFMYLVSGFLPLVYPPVTDGLYLKWYRSVHMVKGFIYGSKLLWVH